MLTDKTVWMVCDVRYIESIDCIIFYLSTILIRNFCYWLVPVSLFGTPDCPFLFASWLTCLGFSDSTVSSHPYCEASFFREIFSFQNFPPISHFLILMAASADVLMYTSMSLLIHGQRLMWWGGACALSTEVVTTSWSWVASDRTALTDFLLIYFSF